MGRRKLLALTAIRSEYDLMSRLFALLRDDPHVELGLIVSGAHLSPMHGHTVDDIRNDGLPILAEVETLISGDTQSSRLKTASGLLAGSIDIVRQYRPDAILFAGDREDVLVGAMLGGFLGIPTVHFFGGDHASDGHIDNAIRHATSKLASAHVVSLEEHRQRLLSLGEPAHRIFVIGSVALDKFVDEPLMTRSQVLEAMAAKPHAATARWAVLIFHPIDDEKTVAVEFVLHAIQALVERGFHVCVGAPNTDPGNHRLVAALQECARKEQITFYRNLSRGAFVNLLRQTEVIVGNSSAGIVEAASVRRPAINIGARQRGRLCGPNVVFCQGSLEDIRSALDRVESADFQRMLKALVNPYGDGRSAERALALLKGMDLQALLSKPEDPLHDRR
jgi:UDP-hydrolysing UDP-N-acetyl-D-glucosamine 2-epimerase